MTTTLTAPAAGAGALAVADAALRCEGLRLGYGDRVVAESVALRLHAGQVTALVGPNGSGKSTVLRALARLHRPDAGSVRLGKPAGSPASPGRSSRPADAAADAAATTSDAADDVDALALHPTAFARRVTLLSQSRPVPGGVTVREVVAYGRHPHRPRWRGTDADGPRAIAHALAVTGTAAMADRPVDELSGGELQRVWLASCLAQDTRVLLLDEPTNHLDLRYQVEVLDLVAELAEDHGVAVGVVLHDLDQAASVADHLALLSRGAVVAAGRPADVLTAERLSEVYGIRVDVTVDPLTGRVRTHPVGRRARTA